MLKIFPFCLSVFAQIAFLLHLTDGSPAKIDPELLSSLETGTTANVLVFFANGIGLALERAATLQLNDRSERNYAIYHLLQDNADSSQSGVIQLLSARIPGDDFLYYKSYWTGNKIFIKGANAETVKGVAEDPQVLKIIKEPIGLEPEYMEVSMEPAVPIREPGKSLWGNNLTQVIQAWDELHGNKGEGIIVGNIDSGVRYTHETLRDNFLGTKYGWYDARFNTTEPEDTRGHGTATMSILAGGLGVGVAPGAKWMACRSGDANGTHPAEALLDCIQWMACPTLSDGSNPDCSKVPDLVSCSWVMSRGSNAFNDDILVWRTLGITPIFAIGNEGARYFCNTTRAPGDLPFVIGVGATTEDDWLGVLSSVGFASDGGIKPDIVAPGIQVVTATHKDDTAYRQQDGTSFAAPHVAGVVALLKVRDPYITYEEIYDFLTQNTDAPILNPSYEERYCNESSVDLHPNIFFGYGRVNALKSVRAQTHNMLKSKK